VQPYKLVLAATLGALCFGAAAAQYATRSTINGVARVLDGDTVVVAGTVVRPKGVDASEQAAGSRFAPDPALIASHGRGEGKRASRDGGLNCSESGWPDGSR